jgi:CubicO group peptidase (beta-lactamase class C family)
MKKTRHSRWGLLVLVVGLATALMAGRGGGTAESLSGPDPQVIDHFVARQMARHGIPGMALAITKGDQVLHLQGYGSAGGGREVTSQTPFYLGSVSKSFTALAVMQLVEAGKIALDDPVRNYLPWFQVSGPGAPQHITVRHLLNQTSGLSRSSLGHVSLDREAPMEQAVQALAAAQPVAPPGVEYHHFNPNYTTLGLIVEAVSGVSYEECIRLNVLNPLRMERTFTSRAEAEPAGLSQGHSVFLGFSVPREQRHLSYDLPAGFISSTAEDMSHYLIAQLNRGEFEGRQVISPQGLAELHRPATEVGSQYAMGWERSSRGEIDIIQHDGSLEAFFASALLLPEQGLGVALLVNQTSLPHMAFAYDELEQGIVNLLLDRQPKSGLSTNAFYVIVALFVLATVGMQARSLARLHRWRESAGDRRLSQLVPGVAWHLVFAALVLVVLPWYVIRAVGLIEARIAFFVYAPEVTLWLALLAVFSLLEGLLKARHVAQIWRSRQMSRAN